MTGFRASARSCPPPTWAMPADERARSVSRNPRSSASKVWLLARFTRLIPADRLVTYIAFAEDEEAKRPGVHDRISNGRGPGIQRPFHIASHNKNNMIPRRDHGFPRQKQK